MCSLIVFSVHAVEGQYYPSLPPFSPRSSTLPYQGRIVGRGRPAKVVSHRAESTTPIYPAVKLCSIVEWVMELGWSWMDEWRKREAII